MNCTETTKIAAKVHDFKAALAVSMHASAAVVPLKAQAMAMGVSPTACYAYADANSHEVPSIARLCLLLPELTDPAAIDCLAGMQGRITVPLPTADGTDACHLTDILHTFATVVDHHAASIADGTWCARDAAVYRERGMALVKAVLAQMAHVDRQVVATRLRKVSA